MGVFAVCMARIHLFLHNFSAYALFEGVQAARLWMSGAGGLRVSVDGRAVHKHGDALAAGDGLIIGIDHIDS